VSTQLALELLACEQGKRQAAERNPDWLALFRGAARHICRRDGDADIERCRELVTAWGYHYPPGNWMGSVFRGWKDTGRRIRARHKGGRAREVRVWTR